MSGAERFAAALKSVGGVTVVAGSRAEAVTEVRRLAGERAVAIDACPELDGVGEGLAVVDDPWRADVGVTSAMMAVEETGTLVLATDSHRPRSTSLVPRVHVALVPASRLVGSYADAVARVAEIRPVPSGVQFVTGPSSSGDIELTLVRGVHGPAEVYVVFSPE